MAENDHFSTNGRNDHKNGKNGFPIPVSSKVVYGTDKNTKRIFTFLPPCIFKQVFRSPKPLKNTVKMTKKWSKTGQKWPIFRSILANFRVIFWHSWPREVSVFGENTLDCDKVAESGGITRNNDKMAENGTFRPFCQSIWARLWSFGHF